MTCRYVLLLVAICLFSRCALGEVVEVTTSSEFQSALNAAMPGHEIVLAPGVYAGRFTGTGLTGVTVRSSDPANPAVIDATGVGEGFKLSSVKQMTLSDLVIENASQNAINIDDGQFVAASEDVTLRSLTVRDSGSVGIKLTGVERFHVDRCQVINWGANWVAIDVIGSHAGLIERSYMQNGTTGSGNGIQVKGGASDIVIRANRLVNANERGIQIGGSTTLSLFRPQPPGTVEASGIVAEGNVILHNGNTGLGIRSAVSFINTADGVFRNNVVYRPSLYAMRILKENRNAGFVNTQKGTVADNIFIWNQGDLVGVVNAGSMTQANTFTFEGNQWYNQTNPSNSTLSLPSTETDGVYGVNPEVDLQGITPWEFSWGQWVVNTSNLADTYSIADGGRYFLAQAGEGSTLDLGADNPLVGDWSLTLVESDELTVEPFSYAILISPAAGDFNLDGLVDQQDYDVWKAAFGVVGESSADGNQDGVVDAADFTIWRDNYTEAGVDAESIHTVPEPDSTMYLLLGALSWISGTAFPRNEGARSATLAG
jgi:hypothetical protein